MTTSIEPITSCMVVIPCLNEARHIEAVVRQLIPSADRFDMNIVVADGGSTDGTLDILSAVAATEPRLKILHNRRKLQSAAVNLAVEKFGDGLDCFIRIDAHSAHPVDYCDRLIEEANATGADSIVVSVITKGFGTFQKATAAAQNSKLGNGGSKHRDGSRGHWIDHGHHGLMRVAAFRSVGGYDETFSHNEDGELDFRLRKAGYRIWMTDRTFTIYYPRASAPALFRQYLGYGRGRAKNLLKHRAAPKIRQIIPLMVLPVVAGSALAFLNVAALFPAGLWIAACVGYGAWMAVGQRNPFGVLAGFSAMIMHLAWSTGFWLQLLNVPKREARSA